MREMDLKEYVETIQNAVDAKEAVQEVVDTAISRNIVNVFIVGCGGTQAIMYPGKYIFDVHSILPAYVHNAGEFEKLNPMALGKRSLVVLSSYTGTTAETVASARLAKAKGSLVVSFVCTPASPLCEASDFVFLNRSNKGSSEANLIRTYQIFFGIIKKNGYFDHYSRIMDALRGLPIALADIKKRAEKRAVQFAESYKNEKCFYVIAGGICWGQALVYANCILEEMQWISAQPIPAGEYFHAPFEIVDESTNLLIFKGEDLSRPLVDRVIDFSQKYTERIVVIDTKDYLLPGVPEDLRGYFSPFVLLSVLDRFSQNLARVRNHPLSTRRYMGKVHY
jgi:fructoselysine-6-P-deglycase FrlB-like protein